jgi:hypothetical protein
VQRAEKISSKAPTGADACEQGAEKISFEAPTGADACEQGAEKISFEAPTGAGRRRRRTNTEGMTGIEPA